jgi:hypothetical protein
LVERWLVDILKQKLEKKIPRKKNLLAVPSLFANSFDEQSFLSKPNFVLTNE